MRGTANQYIRCSDTLTCLVVAGRGRSSIMTINWNRPDRYPSMSRSLDYNAKTTSNLRTSPAKSGYTSPATRSANATCLQHERDDTGNALTQHKTTRNDDQTDVTFVFRVSSAVYTLDDTADKTRERKRRGVEESNRKCDTRWNPLRIP